SVVAGAKAGAIVAAPTDGEWQAVLAGESNGGDHVGHAGAVDDEPRRAIDHRVVDAAGLIVALVARLRDGATDPRGQVFDRAIRELHVWLFDHDGHCHGGSPLRFSTMIGDWCMRSGGAHAPPD